MLRYNLVRECYRSPSACLSNTPARDDTMLATTVMEDNIRMCITWLLPLQCLPVGAGIAALGEEHRAVPLATFRYTKPTLPSYKYISDPATSRRMRSIATPYFITFTRYWTFLNYQGEASY